VLPHADLLASLSALDSNFRTAESSLEAAFCSKLAVIECCGWTEEAMDDIVTRCYTRCIGLSANQQICKESVRKTYGFEYKSHFRKMLGTVIGVTGIERLERRVDNAKMVRLEGALSTLKAVRDTHAHTHIKGVIPNLSAPSFIISQFRPIWDGLREIEARLAERAW
jgi:hypothetical protein